MDFGAGVNTLNMLERKLGTPTGKSPIVLNQILTMFFLSLMISSVTYPLLLYGLGWVNHFLLSKFMYTENTGTFSKDFSIFSYLTGMGFKGILALLLVLLLGLIGPQALVALVPSRMLRALARKYKFNREDILSRIGWISIAIVIIVAGVVALPEIVWWSFKTNESVSPPNVPFWGYGLYALSVLIGYLGVIVYSEGFKNLGFYICDGCGGIIENGINMKFNSDSVGPIAEALEKRDVGFINGSGIKTGNTFSLSFFVCPSCKDKYILCSTVQHSNGSNIYEFVVDKSFGDHMKSALQDKIEGK